MTSSCPQSLQHGCADCMCVSTKGMVDVDVESEVVPLSDTPVPALDGRWGTGQMDQVAHQKAPVEGEIMLGSCSFLVSGFWPSGSVAPDWWRGAHVPDHQLEFNKKQLRLSISVGVSCDLRLVPGSQTRVWLDFLVAWRGWVFCSRFQDCHAAWKVWVFGFWTAHNGASPWKVWLLCLFLIAVFFLHFGVFSVLPFHTHNKGVFVLWGATLFYMIKAPLSHRMF